MMEMWARGVSLLVMLVGAAGCGSEDIAERNRQRILADEAACKDELAQHDAWSTTQLSEQCQRIASIHGQQRKSDDTAALMKKAQLLAKEDEELDKAAGAGCDPKTRAQREAWLVKKVDNAGYMVSARDEGLRGAGGCSQKLVSQSLDCSEANIRTVYGDSPWLSEAHHLGFTRFVCNEVDHLSKAEGAVFRRTVEMPLDSILVATTAHKR